MRILFFLMLVAIAVSLDIQATPANLDGDSVKNLDTYVRREILYKILSQLNDTTLQQNVQSKACEMKLKAAFSTCSTCVNNICKQSPAGHLNQNNILNTLAPLIFKPQLLIGSIVDLIGVGTPSGSNIFGIGGKFLVDKVGELAKELGHTFSDASSVLHGISSRLETLGNSLLSKGVNLVYGAGTLLSQVGHGAESLIQSAGNVANTLGQKVGSGLLNVGTTIGNTFSNLFHSIFGKRELISSVKSCTSSCPICDELDVNVHTNEEVLTSVCGQQYIVDQSKTMQYLNSLKELYNKTLSETLITKVDYDPTSIKTNNGVSFSNSHFTFVGSVGKETVRTNADLSITDLPTTAQLIADQIWHLIQH